MSSDKRYHDDRAIHEKPGIKAQHAVFLALQEHLAQAGTGWTVEETNVGSQADLAGVDIYLINTSTNEAYILDISFKDKEHTPFLVRIRDDWFERNSDGTSTTTPDGSAWIFRKECIRALVQAIRPALAANPIRRQPVFRRR
jgi:hypothetical protein